MSTTMYSAFLLVQDGEVWTFTVRAFDSPRPERTITVNYDGFAEGNDFTNIYLLASCPVGPLWCALGLCFHLFFSLILTREEENLNTCYIVGVTIIVRQLLLAY